MAEILQYPLLPLVPGALGFWLGWRSLHQIRHTTLTGPWIWLMVAIVSLSLAAAASRVFESHNMTQLRLAVSCFTVCPIISLLGAKRPQHRGWHLIVASLWLVLTLPAWEALLLKPGQVPDTRGLRGVFLLLVIGLGAANLLPTRFWPSALLLVCAQLLLLAEWLAMPESAARWCRRMNLDGFSGLVLYVAALGLAWLLPKRDPRPALDQLWLDFRDAYGLLWGLRVAEQINSTASQQGWDLRLRWQGFRRTDGSVLGDALSPDANRILRQNLHNLLRRFVSGDWVASRLAD